MCDICDAKSRSMLSRRGLFGIAAGVALTGLAGCSANAADPAKMGVPPDAALKRLMDGHKAYLAGQSTAGDYVATRADRAKGQAPFASILSCADSRVPPELVFNQGPGSLFVVRGAGNVENDDAIASLEFGSAVLGSQLIMVMGHSSCGAIAAAIGVAQKNTPLPGHLPGLIDRIVPAVKEAEMQKPADLLAAATVENVRLTVQRLSTTQPILAAKVKAGSLRIVGSVYDLATGAVTMV